MAFDLAVMDMKAFIFPELKLDGIAFGGWSGDYESPLFGDDGRVVDVDGDGEEGRLGRGRVAFGGGGAVSPGAGERAEEVGHGGCGLEYQG